jgi:hypothetical protein
MIYSGDAQVRRIYLDVPHSENPKPSWYGESVGHYEGELLVIDTVQDHLRTKRWIGNNLSSASTLVATARCTRPDKSGSLGCHDFMGQ